MTRRRVRILSIDGGGIGGIVPARILARLDSVRPGVVRSADLIAGTSVGALLAVALAGGYTPEMCGRLLINRVNEIFGSHRRRLTLAGGSLWRAKYDPAGLEAVLEELLGHATLGDLEKPVVIPTVALRRPDMGRRLSGKFFSSWSSVDPDLRFGAAAVALASASAPTYFRAARPAPGWLCWDGGLSGHNSPYTPAAAEVRKTNPDAELVILSLGCGATDDGFDAGDWGALQAVASIIRTMLSVSVSSAEFLAFQVMRERFHRVNPVVKKYEIDAAAEVSRLAVEADSHDLEEAIQWLDRWWV